MLGGSRRGDFMSSAWRSLTGWGASSGNGGGRRCGGGRRTGFARSTNQGDGPGRIYTDSRRQKSIKIQFRSRDQGTPEPVRNFDCVEA
jgi:hypothetical protein